MGGSLSEGGMEKGLRVVGSLSEGGGGREEGGGREGASVRVGMRGRRE